MAYGGSVQGLAQNELAENQQRLQASAQVGRMTAENRANAERLLEYMIARKRAEGQDAQQQRNIDRSVETQKSQFQQRFDADQRYRNDALQQQHRDRRMQMLMQRRQAGQGNDIRTQALAEREAKMLLPEINEWADQGGGDGPTVSEEDFRSEFPQAMWGYSRMAVGKAQKAREALKSLYHADLADAETMNRDASLQHMTEQEKVSSWNSDLAPKVRPWMWNRSNTPDKAAVAEWQAERVELAAPTAAIRGDRNRMGRLVPNANGGYDAVAPSWTKSSPINNANHSAVLDEAKRAIQAGKDPQAVRQRLIQMGITPDF